MSHIPLLHCPLAFLDTETTGLIPGTHEVIEIAIRKEFPLTGERVLFHTLIQPEHLERASEKALAINGYRDDPSRWALSPTFKEAAPAILDFLKGAVVVGHNVNYDIDMINGSLRNAERKEQLRHRNIDTMTLCFEHLVPLGLQSLSMDSVREFLGWSKDGGHRALKDIEDLERLYKLLIRLDWFGARRISLGRFLREVGRMIIC